MNAGHWPAAARVGENNKLRWDDRIFDEYQSRLKQNVLYKQYLIQNEQQRIKYVEVDTELDSRYLNSMTSN